MSFDPGLPLENTDIDAAQMRSQLTGLKALIDAILSVTAAQVDNVDTLPPGSPATAGVSVSGNTLHFTFALPQGFDGGPGMQGPPFAGAVVDTVTTLDPGDSATVSVLFDGTNVVFTFGIPRGATGANGADGVGIPGEQGPPGEVTNADLANAINGTSSNTNAVATLDTPFVNDPPTLADMELMRAKVNEMLLTARR